MHLNTLINGTTRKEYTTKETAQFIRAALRAAFPGTKFSVTTEYASMTSSTNIRWTDGPTEPEVTRVTDRYSSRGFDGMHDCTTFHSQTVNGELVSFSGWIHTHRTITPELMARAQARATLAGETNVYAIARRLRADGLLITFK